MKKTGAGPDYGEYLGLDQLLSAQNPLSVRADHPVHDEMLFIIVQQVFELWFKQMLYDLGSVLEIFKSDWVDEKNLGLAVPRLQRVVEIQKNMLGLFPILETMTPLDFLEFRDLFKNASGFQSVQFRKLEQILGVQYPTNPPVATDFQGPSLFTSVEKWLERTPFLNFQGFDFWTAYRKAVERKLKSDAERIEGGPEEATRAIQKSKENFELFLREKTSTRLSHRATQAALLIFLYRDQPILQLPFRLLTLLIDIDDLMTEWRQRHALTVYRMIGSSPGSAYTAGFAYLRETIESRRVFTDLANLSTYLIPRSELPVLPEKVLDQMRFAYAQRPLRNS